MKPTPADKRVLLDLSDLSGETDPVSLFDFIQENSAPGVTPLEDDDVRELRRLRPGQTAHLGIGGGSVAIKRVASSIREASRVLAKKNTGAYLVSLLALSEEEYALQVLYSGDWGGGDPVSIDLVLDEDSEPSDLMKWFRMAIHGDHDVESLLLQSGYDRYTNLVSRTNVIKISKVDPNVVLARFREGVVARLREAAVRFRPGDHVRVKDSHGSVKFLSDTGVIEKYVPFGKYYVELEKNGRSLVSEEDLEKDTSKAASMLPLDESHLVAYVNGAIIKAIREAGGKNINTVLSVVERSGLYHRFMETVIDAIQKYSEEIPSRHAAQTAFPWHAGAAADEGVSTVYRTLLSIKGAMDRMEEIPRDLTPLYNQVGKAIDAQLTAGRETHQLRMMMRNLANRY